jgi:hypothetical protein
MKKTIFLCLILLFANVETINATGNDVTRYEFDEYTIQLDRFYTDEGERGYYVDKLGEETFTITLFIDNAWIDAHGVSVIDDSIVIYGTLHQIDGATFYDAYWVTLNQQGDVIYEYQDDFGELEFVDDVWKFDDHWYFRVNHAYRRDRGPAFFQYTFYVYDEHYQYINHVEMHDEIKNQLVTDELYFFSLDYDHYYEGAIDYRLKLYKPEDSLNIQDEDYIGALYLPVINEAVLNGQPVSNGVLVDYPGYYNLEYNSETYYFTVHPMIDGVEDEGIYSDDVIIEFSGGNAYLNDDVYASGEVIDTPGYYRFIIYGVNQYERELSFKIDAGIEGVENLETYQSPLDIKFNGLGYLNNEFVESPLVVDEPGEYVLQVEGNNSYSEVVHFVIEDHQDKTSFVHFVQQYDGVVLIVVGAVALVYLKKK